MNGHLSVDVSGLDLSALERKADAAAEALPVAMEHIRGIAAPRTPIETGRLVGSATVHYDGGDEASLTYDGPYARYQEFRTDLRHEHGQALYLTSSVIDGKDDAIGIIAQAAQEAD